MTRLFKYLAAYGLWLVDLGLSFWLILVFRTVYLGIFALYYKPGGLAYAHRVGFADKMFILILGIGWLIFMIVTESYFRNGVERHDLFNRFARVTGPVVLGVFSVDLLLAWLQARGDWWRWLILAAEVSLGVILVIFARSQLKSKPT
jgi:hypothetical protein